MADPKLESMTFAEGLERLSDTLLWSHAVIVKMQLSEKEDRKAFEDLLRYMRDWEPDLYKEATNDPHITSVADITIGVMKLLRKQLNELKSSSN